MVEAAFDCAQRLFGLRFVEQPAVEAYHPDVKVYEVRDADDALVGVFLHDNFARPDQAQRRLDELVPQAVAQRGTGAGRSAADRRQQQQLRQGCARASRRC